MKDLGPPLVYQASFTTRECIGSSYADPSPLEPGVWLTPGMATLIAPPETDPGFAAVLDEDGETWQVVEDSRGAVYDISNGSARTWEALGTLPSGFTKLPWPGPYYIWVDGKWSLDEKAEVESLRQAAVSKRDSLLAVAALRIAPLQDAVDLGKASPAKIALLKKWKEYRVDLDDVPEQQNYPLAISWPTEPS